MVEMLVQQPVVMVELVYNILVLAEQMFIMLEAAVVTVQHHHHIQEILVQVVQVVVEMVVEPLVKVVKHQLVEEVEQEIFWEEMADRELLLFDIE